MNIRQLKSLAVALPLACLASCSADLQEPTGYDDVCAESTRPPVVPEPLPDPISSPITTNQQLWDAISFDNGTRVNGNISDVSPNANDITGSFNVLDEFVIFDKAKLTFNVNTSGATVVDESLSPGAVLLQIEGTNSYYFLPVNGNIANGFTFRGPQPPEDQPNLQLITEAFSLSGGTQKTIPLTARVYLITSDEAVPTSTDTLNQDPSRWLISGQEKSGKTPLIVPQAFKSGRMQVTLLWDQPGNDIDLWVTEPDGHKIYYNDKPSSSGQGALDRDDTDGFGAENVFFNNQAPDGEYKIQVDYYAGQPVTRYTVLVRACNQVRTFNGSLAKAKDVDTVLTFNLNDRCTLFPPPPTKAPDFFEEAALCSERKTSEF